MQKRNKTKILLPMHGSDNTAILTEASIKRAKQMTDHTLDIRAMQL
jgi:hypothetical protein